MNLFLVLFVFGSLKFYDKEHAKGAKLSLMHPFELKRSKQNYRPSDICKKKSDGSPISNGVHVDCSSIIITMQGKMGETSFWARAHCMHL